MTSKQKAKGNSWERDICKHLSDLYSESFIRVPNSGAYIGGKNSKRKQVLHEGQIRSFKGDIIPGESFPKLNLEAKNYKDFPFHHLFTGSCNTLDKWIDQCMEVADVGDFNIICIKITRKGTYVAIQISPDLTQDLSGCQLKFQNELIYHTSVHGTWVFMDYEKFWKLNHSIVRTLCK